MSPRSNLPTSIFHSAWIVIVVAVTTSCGSRTGLFGEDGNVVGGSPTDAGGGPTEDGPVPLPVPCTPGRFDLEAAAARLMFVLDRSASMAASLGGIDPPPPGQRSRWQILRDGLSQAILPFDQQIAMGAKFYPEANATLDPGNPGLACVTDNGVGLAPKRGNASSILGVFDTTRPAGATPTSEALRLAAGYLVQSRAVARSIVLATDGAPNCNSSLNGSSCVCAAPQGVCGPYAELCLDDARTIATVKQIAGVQGVPVYVIGLGSTERPEFLRVLDEMAVAGGHPKPTTPRHYNVQTPAELDVALATIRDSAASCTYLTPSSPTNPDGMTIEIDGQVLVRDPSHQDGWDWTDRTYGVIALFGKTCELAQTATRPVAANVRCTN